MTAAMLVGAAAPVEVELAGAVGVAEGAEELEALPVGSGSFFCCPSAGSSWPQLSWMSVLHSSWVLASSVAATQSE